MDNMCPRQDCSVVLDAKADGEFNAWVCPKGHGLGATVTELWGQLQDDEISELWAGIKDGKPSDKLSPALRLPMVTVEIALDDDEVVGNAPADASRITVDVSSNEEFIWFDAGEFEQFAKDLANAEPSAEEQAKIDEIADTFVNEWSKETMKHNRWAALGNSFANAVARKG
jgi:hypothetical protein